MAKSNIAFFDTSFALENLLNLRASGVLPLDPTRTLTCTQDHLLDQLSPLSSPKSNSGTDNVGIVSFTELIFLIIRIRSDLDKLLTGI